MALVTQLNSLVTRIGTEFKSIRVLISGSGTGGITGLTTTDKTSLVHAINEVKAAATGAPPDATETTKGVVELATNAEATTGVDTVRAVTPAGVAAAISGKANTSSLAAVATSGNAADLTGTLPASVLPPLGINETFVVASQAAMLALTAQRGDVAIRTDQNRSYILSTDSPTTLADWKVLTAGGDVTSVAGKTGVVTLVKGDVGLGNVDNTSDANKPVSTAQQTALNLKANLASPTFTGTVGGITKAMVGLSNVDNTSDAGKPVSTATQTALDGKQPLDSDLTAIAALTSAVDKMPYSTGAAAWAMTTITATARTLLADTSVANMRTTLDVYSKAEIGDPETDFVAAFNTAIA